jgi:outer membrane protein TolC
MANRNFLKSLLVLFAGVLIPPMLDSQTPSLQLDSLTLERAVALALEHHPSLQAADASVRLASGVLTQSEANYFPSISASASGTHTEGAFVFNPQFPPRTQSYNQYSTGFQLQQMLYDFGKTNARVSANDKLLEASSLDFESTRGNVILNVQLAYFGLIQAQRVTKVNEETQRQFEQHLAQAKAFYAVGRRPRFDVTKAEVDLANANVSLIRSVNQMRLARVQLENAMGFHPTSKFSITDTFEIPLFSLPMDSARSMAFERRPELRSAIARLAANESLVSASWNQHLPTLSGSAAYTWSGFDFPFGADATPLAGRWNAGITISLPLFQGFAINAQIEQARANADAAKANIRLLQETLSLEVEQNYLSLKEAEERIGATKKLIDQASENLKLAEGRYASGVGSAIEITDAQVTLSNARITNIQALYDYNVSLATLQRAMSVTGK